VRKLFSTEPTCVSSEYTIDNETLFETMSVKETVSIVAHMSPHITYHHSYRRHFIVIEDHTASRWSHMKKLNEIQ